MKVVSQITDEFLKKARARPEGTRYSMHPSGGGLVCEHPDYETVWVAWSGIQQAMPSRPIGVHGDETEERDTQKRLIRASSG